MEEKKKQRESLVVEGLELQLISTPPSSSNGYHHLLHLLAISLLSGWALPARPRGVGGLQPGPPASVTLAPSLPRNENTWVSSPLVRAVSSPFQQLFAPFN